MVDSNRRAYCEGRIAREPTYLTDARESGGETQELLVNDFLQSSLSKM